MNTNQSTTQFKKQLNYESHQALVTEKNKRVGYKSATALLSSPKMNLTARGRRKLKKARQVRYISTQKPKFVTDRMQDKVKGFSMVSLVRTIAKTQRRIAEATRLLEDLASDSMMREPLLQQKENEETFLVVAQNEYDARMTKAKSPIKDCRAPNLRRGEALRKVVSGAN